MNDYAIEILMEDVAAADRRIGSKVGAACSLTTGVPSLPGSFAIHRIRDLEGLVIMNVPHPAVVDGQPEKFPSASSLLVHPLFPDSVACPNSAGPPRCEGDRF